MIKIDKLDKYFNKNKRNEIHVINNTTLSFENTGLVCILGESGSGKTTLLNTVGGLDSFSGGSITIDDMTLEKYSASEMDKLRNRKYGYIFQNYYLLSDYTVEYNIKLALKCLNMDDSAIEERVNYVLEAVEMRKYKKRKVSELSGGQRQRVAIARALAKTPDVIFADEPTGNLDENNTLRIMSILKKASKNCLVILVTHEQRIADFFADRIIKVKDGVIIEDKLNSKRAEYISSEDTVIYLKELEKQEIKSKDSCINIYTDSSEFRANIDIVFCNGKMYISSDAGIKAEYISDESETKLIDDVKPKLNIEEIDNFEFELEKVLVEGSNRLTFTELFSMACYNIKNIGKKQLFMYVVFVISSVLMLLSVSDFYGVISAKSYEKTTSDSHYVMVNCKDTGTAERAYNQFMDETDIEADIYTSKRNWLSVTSHNYAQLKNVNQIIKNYTYVDIKNITKDQLLYGRMPENEYEIVVDKAVLEGILGGNTVLGNISGDVIDFLNTTAEYNAGEAEFTICGISNNDEMSVYIAPQWIKWGGNSDEGYYLKKNFQLYTDEPEAVQKYFTELNSEYIGELGEENKYREPVVKAVYTYGDEIRAFEEEIKEDIQVRTIITGIIFILSIVVLVFTMKANSLRRTEELVVYRLIGITPGNIIMSYVIEISVITVFTQLIPILVAAMVCEFLSGVKAFEMASLCPWNYILCLIVGIFVVNILVSVLSVVGIIKRPPAQLAAKN